MAWNTVRGPMIHLIEILRLTFWVAQIGHGPPKIMRHAMRLKVGRIVCTGADSRSDKMNQEAGFMDTIQKAISFALS